MSVELHINSNKTEVEPGLLLHEYAELTGIHIPTSCNRQGKCKECLVEITEGIENLSPRVPQEAHLKGKFRLSCRTRLIADNGVLRYNTMHRGSMKIQSAYVGINNAKLNFDPAVTRIGDRILLDGLEIDRNQGPIYGIAMDLGTTTVVLRLFNLESGALEAESSFENPQRFGGSDIMSRIRYDTEHKGKLLQRTLAGYITHAIEEFPVDPKKIYEMVATGNSTMRDLFFRLNVYSIGQYPYRSITEIELNENKRNTTSITESPKRLLLPINSKARVYGLPIISGHVGADAAACMLTTGIGASERLCAIMDIGTNTEIIVGSPDKIYAASCPAGPAFEGGNILCGMPALPGAIEKIKLNKDGSFALEIIGDAAPQGICGSGLIDILSELLENERMNTLGRFSEENKIILYDDGNNNTISISESDVNELAQAKGANAAGLHILFNNYGINFNDLDTFYLAGGFGRYLNIDSAKHIGLIPDIDNSKIVQIGNASIEGAGIALLSRTKRLELENLVKKVVHCRLENDPEFFNYFVEGCQFNPIQSKHGKTDNRVIRSNAV